LSKEQAEATLTANGLVLGVTTRKASSSPEGTVISQSPSLGKMAAKGSTVSIVLSSGNESSTQTVAEEEIAAQSTPVPETNTTTDSTTTNTGSSTVNTDTSNTASNTDTDTSSTAAEPSTKTFTVKIPDAANDTVEVEIIADGRTIHDAVHSKDEGSVSVEIKGSGSTSVQAYIDGAKVSDKIVEFN
jgi:beta-lactam-binding protein with PASTA domain